MFIFYFYLKVLINYLYIFFGNDDELIKTNLRVIIIITKINLNFFIAESN